MKSEFAAVPRAEDDDVQVKWLISNNFDVSRRGAHNYNISHILPAFSFHTFLHISH